MKKIGRNQPCPCGSGIKFKKCHGNPRKLQILEEGHRQLQVKHREFLKAEAIKKSVHGHGKDIISAETDSMRVVAVGNQLFFEEKEKMVFFGDFLHKYLGNLLGVEWFKLENNKNREESHIINTWLQSFLEFTNTQVPNSEGAYSQLNGAGMSWFRLAYDLYQIQHNEKLQEHLLRRLKDPGQFQGARFELLVCASMISAGYEIEFEDELDRTVSHPEFVAIDKNTGDRVAIEAKSKHRNNILGYTALQQNFNQVHEKKLGVHRLLNKAIQKEPGIPYIIFLDLNLPISGRDPECKQIVRKMDYEVGKINRRFSDKPCPINALIFINDSSYHDMEKTPPDLDYWAYGKDFDNLAYVTKRQNLFDFVIKAVIQRSNIPNNFPMNI